MTSRQRGLLNDLAAAVPVILEHRPDVIDRRPVVHRVDHELARRGRIEHRELVKWDREHHHVRLLDGIGCPPWLGSRGQYLGQ
jgi:hypothetical protein